MLLYYSLSRLICKACCLLTTSQYNVQQYNSGGYYYKSADQTVKQGEVYDLNTQGGDSVWIQWMFLSYNAVVCTFCQKSILCHGMPADLFLRGLWKGNMWLVDITLQQPLLHIGCWLGLIFLSKCCGAQFAQTNYGGIQNQSEFLSYITADSFSGRGLRKQTVAEPPTQIRKTYPGFNMASLSNCSQL